MDRDLARKHLGIEDAFVVGWVGSFRAFHGLEALVDACKRAVTPQRLVLLLIGDGAERQTIEQRCTANRVDAVFTGSVAQDDAFAQMAAFDCGVVTGSSAADEFHYSPLKLKEYLAAGVPVVAPRVGEMGRVLQHERTALLYETGDVVMLAQMFQQLAAQPALRRSLADAGQRLCATEFSIAAQVELVVERLRTGSVVANSA
jgi:glycosyltransferase involved in cell wall biosynthesis